MRLLGAVLVAIGVVLLFPLAPVGIPLLVGGALLLYFGSSAAPAANPLEEGVRLLNHGRYSAALEQFRQLAARQPVNPLVQFNVGVACLQLWQLDKALAAFERAVALGASRDHRLARLLPEYVALATALLNRPDSAQRLAQARSAGGDPSKLAIAEAVLSARSGDFTAARAKLGTFEARQLGGVMGALGRAADAFCVERLTGELRHVDRIGLFGETGADGLRAVWPELVTFIERAPPL